MKTIEKKAQGVEENLKETEKKAQGVEENPKETKKKIFKDRLFVAYDWSDADKFEEI